MLIRLAVIGVLAAGFGFAQADESPGAGMGSSDTGVPKYMEGGTRSRLEQMAKACNLTGDQKKEFKALLDGFSKEGEQLRKEIPEGRTQIAEAIEAGKTPGEIKQLTDANGARLAQMTQLEIKAFAKLYNVLQPNQRKVGAQRVFNTLAGLFMKKNWDTD
jgi:Spy/CpxP family protein refolding chaperone